jgi:hypothetical protein
MYGCDLLSHTANRTKEDYDHRTKLFTGPWKNIGRYRSFLLPRLRPWSGWPLGSAPPLFISKYITKEIYLEKTKMVNNWDRGSIVLRFELATTLVQEYLYGSMYCSSACPKHFGNNFSYSQTFTFSATLVTSLSGASSHH